MERSSALLGLMLLGTSLGCSRSREPVTDAGSGDAGAAELCDRTFETVEVSGGAMRLDTELPSVGVALQRVLPMDDGGVLVLVFVADGPGGFRVLARFDVEGRLAWRTEVSRSDVAFSATADVARTPSGWRVQGIDRGEIELTLWQADVDDAGSIVREDAVLVPDERGDGSALTGLALLPTSVEPDAYLLRAGRLVVRTRGEETALDVSFGGPTRLSGTRSSSGATTCLVARDLTTGAIELVRLTGRVEVSERVEIVSAGASYNPQPIAREGACELAYFEPDVVRPSRGRMRIWGRDASIVGWAGTTPIGHALQSDGSLVLAAANPEWPDRYDVWWIRPADGECATPEPQLVLPLGPRGTPLGALLAAETPSGARLVLGGLTASDEVRIATPR